MRALKYDQNVMMSAAQTLGSDAASAASNKLVRRKYPIGAEVFPEGVHFRVWAPKARAVAVKIGEGTSMHGAHVHDLEAEPGGYFSGMISSARAGDCYRFVIGDGEFPDPASRFQLDGPHGPSQVVGPHAFQWTDANWRGVSREGQIIYELHIGTFTREGTWAAATERLPALQELGVTLLEVMPVADFPGKFGWGYDGVNLFAPSRLYGSPDDMRRFVDRAHALGLGVILDVVYNHFGPDGNYVRTFSDHYFSTRYKNEWGDPLNFDDENSGPVREFFTTNAAYWIDEYHLDGLRLDATQQIFDASEEYIVASIAKAARKAAGRRQIYLVAENEAQEARLARAFEQGGCGLDAIWNDDFHHAARVALTQRREAYYSDYLGRPQEFVSAAKWGFLFQGQRYQWQRNRRGQPALDLQPSQFVICIQNHDQVANALVGLRLHELANPAQLRAMTAWLLLGPSTPMLFQGQEFAASCPFHYFADHHPELARLVAEGRRSFLSQFPSAIAGLPTSLARPDARESFEQCKLDWSEREKHAAAYRLHADLIRIRRGDPVISHARREMIDGAVIGPAAFVFRYFSKEHGDRLVVVNLGGFSEDPAPEPLLAPPDGCLWSLEWVSEAPEYGGMGILEVRWEECGWPLLPHSTLFFKAKPNDDANPSHPEN